MQTQCSYPSQKTKVCQENMYTSVISTSPQEFKAVFPHETTGYQFAAYWILCNLLL